MAPDHEIADERVRELVQRHAATIAGARILNTESSDTRASIVDLFIARLGPLTTIRP